MDSTQAGALDRAVRDLAMIGLDRAAGYFDTVALDAWVIAGQALGAIPQLQVEDLAASLEHRGGDAHRRAQRVRVGRAATSTPRGTFRSATSPIISARSRARNRSSCSATTGSRSAIGASLLRARGFDRVSNLTGGIAEWIKGGLPTVTDAQRTHHA